MNLHCESLRTANSKTSVTMRAASLPMPVASVLRASFQTANLSERTASSTMSCMKCSVRIVTKRLTTAAVPAVCMASSVLRTVGSKHEAMHVPGSA